jgi:hypothetical protein
MYFLRARYMNPRTGRFWTMDEYEGDNWDRGSLHKYLHCGSEPVNSIDPTGHENMARLVAVGSMIMTIAAQYAQSAMRLGGQVAGQFFNALGGATQRLAEAVLRNIKGLQVWVNYSFEGARRGVDFFVQGYARVGPSIQRVSAYIECKYRVPEAGSEAMVRLQQQVETALLHGEKDAQVVVWTLKPMSPADVQRLQETFGTYAHRVKLLHGVKNLSEWAKLYFNQHK